MDRQAPRRHHTRSAVPHGLAGCRLDRGECRTMTAQPMKDQVVLVLQGGGALGAYQAGVYQALMEGGIEPDWVIGTSIGAINSALIAGNKPQNRVTRLREFWDSVVAAQPLGALWSAAIFGNTLANLNTIISGIPGF